MDEDKPNECIHYWIIETPAYKRRNYKANYDSLGSWSRGICKKCKEERKFDNSPVTKTLNINYEAMKIKREREKEKKQEMEKSLQNGGK